MFLPPTSFSFIKILILILFFRFLPFLISLGFGAVGQLTIRLALFREDGILSQLKTWGVSVREVYFGQVLHVVAFQFLPFLLCSVVLAAAFGMAFLDDGGRWLAFFVPRKHY